MAKKQSKIRWRDSDTAELQRTINNFNAKLYRLKKKSPEMVDFLPSRLKKSEVIKSIETRADFNRVINSVKRFSNKGAENPVSSSRGAKATQWELDEFNKAKAIENARRTRERKKLEKKDVSSRGKKTGSKVSEMGSIRKNELKPLKTNFENLSNKEWELAKGNIERAINPLTQEFQKHNMRLNYIKGLRNAGYSDDIIALVLEMPIDKFIETTQIDREADFDFIYDPIEFKMKQDALYEVWESALERSKGG